MKYGGISHSGLLLSTTNNNGYYILEYSEAKRTQLYPVKIQIITTYHEKFYQDIVINGIQWTKQLNGAKPDRLWTINEAKEEMEKQLKGKYAIYNDECCHIGQQLVRKAMGMTINNEWSFKQYGKMGKIWEMLEKAYQKYKSNDS